MATSMVAGCQQLGFFMADRITPEQRSSAMSKVKGQNTKIEVYVRSVLHAKGFRFRKNVKSLPGKPDIVLPKYRTVIFINGCFWHQHEKCKRSTLPKTRTEFWSNKLAGNVTRDKSNIEKLRLMGWKVLTVWECSLRSVSEEKQSFVIEELIDFIKNKYQIKS